LAGAIRRQNLANKQAQRVERRVDALPIIVDVSGDHCRNFRYAQHVAEDAAGMLGKLLAQRSCTAT